MQAGDLHAVSRRSGVLQSNSLPAATKVPATKRISTWQPLPKSVYRLIALFSMSMVFFIVVAPASWNGMRSAAHAHRLWEETPDWMPLERNISSKIAAHPLVHFTHVLPGVIWAGSMPLQFHDGMRRTYPAAHRYIGRASMLLSVLPMAAGVFILDARRLITGTGSGIPLIEPVTNWTMRLMAVWFVITAALSVQAARRFDFSQHQIWILRHTASGLWVSLQRYTVIFLGSLHALSGGKVVSWSGERRKILGFLFSSATAIIVTLSACEALLWRMRRERGRKLAGGARVRDDGNLVVAAGTTAGKGLKAS